MAIDLGKEKLTYTNFCPSCGNAVPSGAVHCTNCGAAISGATPTQSAPVQNAPTQPTVNPTATTYVQQPNMTQQPTCYCKNCGAPMQVGATVCMSCGFAANTGNQFCKTCGTRVNPGQAVCIQCGSALSAAANPNAKSKLVAGLLGIFLGSLGIHNFYVGNTKRAVIQLLITILGSCIVVGPFISEIWGLVEGIFYLTGHEGYTTDANGNPLKD